MTRLETDATSAPRWPAVYVVANLGRWVAGAFRPPRSGRVTAPGWRAYLGAFALGAVATAATMVWIDAATIAAVARLPTWVITAFNELTDFGRSGWFLIPLAVLILTAAVADRPWLDRWSHRVVTAVVVRAGFLFVAIGLPGLVQAVLKRLIGRVRPSELGPFAYEPFSWAAKFHSLPSGHAATAFSALVAFGALFPPLRPILWTYAALIAASRVVIAAHYPSDVLAGALVGALGALLVRDWFARRRYAFAIGPDGSVRALPGPSLARLKRVARRLVAS